MNSDKQARKAKRGIYLLPNLLTTGAMFAGFFAVVSAMRGNFAPAAASIFIAMLFDGLDGRVARMTNTQSDFGAQLDSLSDMLAFGLAPALVVFSWALADLGKIGWLCSFLYAAATALRLARFNTQSYSDKKFFQGLPCPAAAAVVAGMVWTFEPHAVPIHFLAPMAAAITTAVALLMVSKIRYHSFKQLDFKGRVPFISLVAVLLIIILISLNPAKVLFIAFAAYAAFGVVATFYNWRRARLKRKSKK